jgi:hypothetical protein
LSRDYEARIDVSEAMIHVGCAVFCSEASATDVLKRTLSAALHPAMCGIVRLHRIVDGRRALKQAPRA